MLLKSKHRYMARTQDFSQRGIRFYKNEYLISPPLRASCGGITPFTLPECTPLNMVSMYMQY